MNYYYFEGKETILAWLQEKTIRFLRKVVLVLDITYNA